MGDSEFWTEKSSRLITSAAKKQRKVSLPDDYLTPRGSYLKIHLKSGFT